MQGRPSAESDISKDSTGQLIPVSGAPPAAYQNQSIAPLGDQHRPAINEPDLGYSLRRHLSLLRKYRWLHIAACLLSIGAGITYTWMRTPLYSATARIQIDRASQEILKPNAAPTHKTPANDYLRTQYALLSSRSMAERVVTRLSLVKDADFFAPRRTTWRSMIGSLSARQPSAHQKKTEHLKGTAAHIINSNVVIRPLPGSRLVDIRYKDPESSRAARIANAYAAAYIASNIDNRLQANNYAQSFLAKQIKQLRSRLETSEKVLLRFAEQEKVIATSEQASIAEESLSAANAALGQLVTERIKNQELWHQVKNAASIQMPQFLKNTVIDQLRSQRKALMNKYQEMLETFKPGYPAMRRIMSKVNEIDRQLTAETQTIRASFEAAYQNSASQEEEMREQIETLRTNVLNLKNKQIRYNILKRETDSNRSLYNDLLKRSKEIDVTGSARASNVFVVDRARITSTPSEPRFNRTLLLAILLGLGASTFVAYTIELLDDRIHSPADVEQLTGLMTVGVIPQMSIKYKERPLGAQGSRSKNAEAYRSLATALQLTMPAGMPRSITITSTSPGEGKSSTSIALAKHFATLGLKVLLIDGNLNKPTLHSRMHLENLAGLSCYLTGALAPADIIQKTEIENLSFIASGPLNPDAADRLAGPQLKTLIAAGSEVFDLIVISSPHVLDTADAILMSNATSATLFVVAAKDQRKGVIRRAVHQLHMARTPLAGTVLTNYENTDRAYR